jgi:hypothetical protein
MKRTLVKVFTVVLGVAACLSLLTTSTANAYDVAIDLPAGLACADFGLRIEITGSGTQVYKEFLDKNGNLIRTLSAGKGWDMLFINASTGTTFPIKGNGSVSHILYNPDGTYTYVATGHNVIIFFPTDVDGPFTKQYIGRMVFTVDALGVSTVKELSGKQVDICAALSN